MRQSFLYGIAQLYLIRHGSLTQVGVRYLFFFGRCDEATSCSFLFFGWQSAGLEWLSADRHQTDSFYILRIPALEEICEINQRLSTIVSTATGYGKHSKNCCSSYAPTDRQTVRSSTNKSKLRSNLINNRGNNNNNVHVERTAAVVGSEMTLIPRHVHFWWEFRVGVVASIIFQVVLFVFFFLGLLTFGSGCIFKEKRKKRRNKCDFSQHNWEGRPQILHSISHDDGEEWFPNYMDIWENTSVLPPRYTLKFGPKRNRSPAAAASVILY